MSKLAIVGNGVVSQNYSDEIDACDEVMRFSRCDMLSKGTVGSKTTILALGEWEAPLVGALNSKNTIENCKLNKPEIWIIALQHGNYMDLPKIRAIFEPTYVKLIFPQNGFFDPLWEIIEFPTAGMMHLYHLYVGNLCRFKGWKKIIYGFTLNAVPGASRAHWKRAGKEWEDKCSHDFVAEGRLIRKWARLGHYSIQPPTQRMSPKVML